MWLASVKTERVKVEGNYIHNETGTTEDKIMGEFTRLWDIIQRAMWGPLRVLRRRVTWFDFFYLIRLHWIILDWIGLDWLGLDWIEWIKADRSAGRHSIVQLEWWGL